MSVFFLLCLQTKVELEDICLETAVSLCSQLLSLLSGTKTAFEYLYVLFFLFSAFSRSKCHYERFMKLWETLRSYVKIIPLRTIFAHVSKTLHNVAIGVWLLCSFKTKFWAPHTSGQKKQYVAILCVAPSSAHKSSRLRYTSYSFFFSKLAAFQLMYIVSLWIKSEDASAKATCSVFSVCSSQNWMPRWLCSESHYGKITLDVSALLLLSKLTKMRTMSVFLLLKQNSKCNKLEEYGLCFLCAAQKNY